MRAITLEIQAFGPYFEKQKIDFRELGTESIFLITGPTGAGKTTIFDAICYALYGRASGSERDQDSLRSHFATDGDLTEVRFVFELKGKVYQAIRSPKQLRKKARGEGFTEEPVKAQLYELDTDHNPSLITSRVTEVNQEIEKIIGFDYEQFRKMVLIPQGEFRKLISENSKEREAILQKIFRTYFYEDIALEFKEKAKLLKQEIEKVSAQIEIEFQKIDWQYITISERDSKLEIIEKLNQEITHTKEKLEVTEIEYKKHESKKAKLLEKHHEAKLLLEKFVEKEKLEQEKALLNEQLPVHRQRIEIVRRAKKANQVKPYESQKQSRLKDLKAQQDKLQIIENTFEETKEALLQVKEAYDVEKNQESLRTEIRTSIAEKEKQFKSIEAYLQVKEQYMSAKNKHQTIEKEYNVLKDQLTKQEVRLNQLEKDLQNEQQIIEEHYQLRETLRSLKDKQLDLEQLKKHQMDIKELRTSYFEVNNLLKARYVDQKKLNYTLTAKISLQREHFVAELAQQLQTGSPCPVCGSVDHVHKATVRDKSIVSDATIKEAQDELNKINELVRASEQELTKLKTVGEEKRHIIQQLFTHLTGKETYPKDEESIKLRELLNKQTVENEEKQQENSHLRDEMAKKKQERAQLLDEHANFKQTFEQLSDNLRQYDHKIIQFETLLKEKSEGLPTKPDEIERFKKTFQETTEYYEALIQNWERIQEEFKEVNEKYQREESTIQSLKSFVTDLEEKVEEASNNFQTALAEYDFNGIADYETALLLEDELEKLEKVIEEFNHDQATVTARLIHLESQITHLEKPNLNTIDQQIYDLEQMIHHQHQEILLLQNKINHDIHALKSTESLYQEIKSLDEEYYTVGDLAELTSGNNSYRLSFERYVLASFLDEILLQANIRLARMTDKRFELIRSDAIARHGAQSGLDLEVIDYHTGNQRSVKTLSGGEGFKAALSLALGLADVVQAHAGGVQLDTLFIDEGFGTLDDVSLQQAINCLKDLQDSNRLLGIISHVPQLKSEIHAKLQITPSYHGSKLKFVFGIR